MHHPKTKNKFSLNCRRYYNCLTNEYNYNFPEINYSKWINQKYNSRPNSQHINRNISFIYKNIPKQILPKMRIKSAEEGKIRYLLKGVLCQIK